MNEALEELNDTNGPLFLHVFIIALPISTLAVLLLIVPARQSPRRVSRNAAYEFAFSMA